MAEFVNEFTAGPIGTNAANNIDSYIRADAKNALDERFALEHVSLRSAALGATDSANPNAQGRHIPGKVGVMGKGTSAEMAALSGMGNGALFLNTTTGYFYYYTQGVGWQIVPISYTGVIATDEEAAAGVVENKAINPKQLKTEIVAAIPKYLHIRDEKDKGTSGDTSAITWTKVTLNTKVFDSIVSTLSSNQFILPAGTYELQGIVPFVRFIGDNIARYGASRLYNVTGSAVLAIGSSSPIAYGDLASDSLVHSYIRGRFTLEVTSTLELQAITSSTTVKIGAPANLSTQKEVYSEIEIWKLG